MVVFLKEYINFLIYGFFSITVAMLMVSFAHFASPDKIETEKISPYECGFEPFTNARIRFDVTFSTVAILYLIFDLEIIFIIPWVINSISSGILGYFTVLIFLVLLMLGFIFEWSRGALDWRVFN